MNQGGLVFFPVGRAARQQLVEDAPESIEICSKIDGFIYSACLLRRDERQTCAKALIA